jgi:predicted ferric reductase
MSVNPPGQEKYESSVNILSFLIFLVAMTVGLLVAVLLLPAWLPNMAFSLAGDAPKAYWYLSRATAFVSLSLLWLSMALGLGITNKMARLWPGAPAAFAIHEYVSLLGLAFAVFHAIVILGDHYIQFTLLQLITPFSTTQYRPLWVGLGQVGLYTWAILAASFYIRPVIGQKSWRFLHYGSFGMYLLGIFHGIFSGTDTGAVWAQNYYWYSAGSLIFLLMYRILASVIDKRLPQNKKPAAPAPRPTQG